jgi:hypothetical protein
MQLPSRDGKVCYYYNRDGTVYERLVSSGSSSSLLLDSSGRLVLGVGRLSAWRVWRVCWNASAQLHRDTSKVS